MPTITVYIGKKASKITVDVCPDCRGTGVVMRRSWKHRQPHLRVCTRCKGAA